MKGRLKGLLHGRLAVPAAFVLSSLALSAFAVDSSITEKALAPTVPRASCGAGDHPETALQGQVPAYIRSAGFKGFNCNLQLVGQVKGDGANWQTAEFKDRAGHICGYHGTSFSTANRTSLGVSAVDVTNAASPIATSHLTTISMLDPWESLKVNDRRQLLAADNGHNGGGGPEVDIYDISLDCRTPQLLSSIAVGKADGSTGVPATVLGHEGNWAPDGLTYYIGDLRSNGGRYYAVDTADPVHPKLITGWKPPVAIPHGLSVSDDGNIGYFVAQGSTPVASLNDPTVAPSNGLLVYDLSQVQARAPNPQVPLIGQLLWKDGANAQHTIPVKIGGKPYLIFVMRCRNAAISHGANHRHRGSHQPNPSVAPHAGDKCSQSVFDGPARYRGSFFVHLWHSLLQRRQQAKCDHACVRIIQFGHSRVRYPQPVAGKGDCLLQPRGYDHRKPRL
jgi:hypothetical protein